jgi:thioesterase domain-containing protein
MVPSAFVALQELPRTPAGKVDRKALPATDRALSDSSDVAIDCNDPIETELVMIWEDVLRLHPIGPLDNFFELGGHSLLAVQLLSRIAAAFGQTLPLRSLFVAPTIRGIAGHLRQGTELPVAWPTLIPLQPHGARPPLFCVAAPNANALGFVFLARQLGSEQPAYGLQRQDSSNPERFYTQDEYSELAAESIDDLNSIWPEGPCLLCGFCEGAHIAFEMARQLEAAGREVALVAMFDAWPLENTVSRFRHRLLGAVHRFKKRWRYGRLSQAIPFLRRQFIRLSGVMPQIDLSADGAQGLPPDLLEVASWQRWQERLWPGKDFNPPVYNGRITVFRVRRQPRWRIQDDSLGWRIRATQGVEIVSIPGDHATILREPHVQVLAAKLAACLTSVGR